jgi:hypothetical protein
MAAYAERVFQDLGRRALQMADYEAKGSQTAFTDAKHDLVAKVADAEGEGTDLEADWRVVRYVYGALRQLYKELGRLGAGSPFLAPTTLNEVEQEAARMGDPRTRRRALATLHQRKPDVMEEHWGELHATLVKLDIEWARRAALDAAAGDGGSSSKRPRPEWRAPPGPPRAPGPRGPSVVHRGRTVLICGRWLADPHHVAPCSRMGCRYAPCGGRVDTGAVALSATELDAVKAEALRLRG